MATGFLSGANAASDAAEDADAVAKKHRRFIGAASARSERQLERELQGTVIGLSIYGSLAGDAAERGTVQCRGRRGEVGVIDGVESFEARLHPGPLGDGE